MVRNFAEKGYKVKAKLFNAADFGVPQHRERVILVGIRDDINNKYNFPEKTNDRSKPVTLKDVLRGQPIPGVSDVCQQPFSPRYMSRNRKRGWNEISYTIPAMSKQVPLHPSSPDMVKLERDLWRFGEYGVSRRFAWWEAALVQSFPKDFVFKGDLVSRYRQIGNAVPPLLAEAIAKSLYSFLACHVSGGEW